MNSAIENPSFPDFAILLLSALVLPAIVAYISHASQRSRHKKSQIDALSAATDIDMTGPTPEQSLVLHAALEHAYGYGISTADYRILRQATEPGIALSRFKYMRRFVRACGTHALQYRRIPFLFDRRRNVIPKWRVAVLFVLLAFVSSLVGLGFVLLSAAAATVGDWSWLTLGVFAVSALYLGVAAYRVALPSVEQFTEFLDAAGNLFEPVVWEE